MEERAQAVPSGTVEEGFDTLLERLQEVVRRLESGSLSLEESLRAFEEGVQLAGRGQAILDRAEKRVEILARGEGGTVEKRDFGEDGDEH